MSDTEIRRLVQEQTPEDGTIRLEAWPEGYVLWHHGQIAWRSWRKPTEISTLVLKLDASEVSAMIQAEVAKLHR